MGPTKDEMIDGVLFKHFEDGQLFTTPEVLVLLKIEKYYSIPAIKILSKWIGRLPSVEDLGVIDVYEGGRRIQMHRYIYHKPKESLWMKKWPTLSRYAKRKS